MRVPLFMHKALIKSLALVGLLSALAWSQISSRDREQKQEMLWHVASDVREHYYDPKLHGIDWSAKVREAKEKIEKATSLSTINLEIAAVLETLNDSHTFFLPPTHVVRAEYDWRYQMVGNRCYVTQVKLGGDAQTKGLKPGDEVLTIEGFTPARESLWKMEYVLNVLQPQFSLRMDLRAPSGVIRKVEVMASNRQTEPVISVFERDIAKQRRERHLRRARYVEINGNLAILKLPDFSEESNVHDMIDKAQGHKTLVVDLRGNQGGQESILQALLGSVFDRDVKIADRIMRKTSKPVIAKSNHRHLFAGELTVLVDSQSASAAELFARVVQIEKRGTILGDRTSGSVMEANEFNHETRIISLINGDTFRFYGVMVAVAEMVMTDGKSLEHTGVIPDETILPTAADLANDRDPVLAHAAEMAGVTLTPADAAKLFPYEWPTD